MNTVLLRKGKTKEILIYRPERTLVRITDAITAGNGKTSVIIPGKGRVCCDVANNMARILSHHRIDTSFINQEMDMYSALYTDMLPLEVVCRSAAAGSYLKRHPGIIQGTPLHDVVEFYFKKDELNDPLIEIDGGGHYTLYPADKPIAPANGTPIMFGYDEGTWPLPVESIEQVQNTFKLCATIARQAFRCLHDFWTTKDFSLVDIKFEFGFDYLGRLIISDAITPDEWRLWHKGDPNTSYDKDVFRKAGNKEDPELKSLIIERYQYLADVSK